MNWSDRIIDFMSHLEVDAKLLPEGILPLYPLKGENSDVTARIVDAFYRKYYNDQRKRKFIIGINPGRLGAGATGIPFTDTKRLVTHCGIEVPEFHTHEPSSVFIYHMIDAFGGPEAFYRQYYITSVCPIGFVKEQPNGKALNYNYYDSQELSDAIRPYVVEKFRQQIDFGADTSCAFCLGTGKNYKFLKQLNDKTGLFGKIVPLEHPRYIVQYKNKSIPEYIDKYLSFLVS